MICPQNRSKLGQSLESIKGVSRYTSSDLPHKIYGDASTNQNFGKNKVCGWINIGVILDVSKDSTPNKIRTFFNFKI